MSDSDAAVAKAPPRLLPGLLASVTVAFAAQFLHNRYGGPAMLFALLLGIAFNFLYDDGVCTRGIDFAAKRILRVGIALLGLRISFDVLAGFGLLPAFLVVGSVILTIASGYFVAKLLKLPIKFGILTGGSVAICGASAALVISSILPKGEDSQAHDRDTLFAVIGVTSLSTIAMIAYPVITQLLGFNDEQSGLFMGATIHDVAQVVGAGYSISTEAGDIATLTKLLRVAMLLPVALFMSLAVRNLVKSSGDDEDRERPPLVPAFLIAFAALVGIQSFGLIPENISKIATELSQLSLIAAVAAIGMKTKLKEMTTLGAQPVILIVAETLFLAILVALAIAFGHLFEM